MARIRCGAPIGSKNRLDSTAETSTATPPGIRPNSRATRKAQPRKMAKGSPKLRVSSGSWMMKQASVAANAHSKRPASGQLDVNLMALTMTQPPQRLMAAHQAAPDLWRFGDGTPTDGP